MQRDLAYGEWSTASTKIPRTLQMVLLMVQTDGTWGWFDRANPAPSKSHAVVADFVFLAAGSELQLSISVTIRSPQVALRCRCRRRHCETDRFCWAPDIRIRCPACYRSYMMVFRHHIGFCEGDRPHTGGQSVTHKPTIWRDPHTARATLFRG